MIDVMGRGGLDEALMESQRRAFKWVEAQLPLFNPLTAPGKRRFDLAVKAAAELALLCSCIGADASGYELVQQIASFLWKEVVSTEGMRDYLINTERDLLAFGMYSALEACGYRDDWYRAELSRVLDRGVLSARERVSFRQLDLLHSLQRLGFDTDEAAVEAEVGRSLLARHPTLYELTVEDVYALTHTIFFATDFGRRGDVVLHERDRSYLAQALPLLLGYYLRCGHWDLAGELLIGIRATEQGETDIERVAWPVLARAQREDGAFPGPVEEKWEQADAPQSVGPSKTEDDLRWEAFRDHYHTTLVMILAYKARASR